MRLSFVSALSAAALLLGASAAFAQPALIGTETTEGTAPLWEAGVFAAGGYVSHYPAASEGQFRALPLPYIIYRGDTLRIGDDGFVRARKELADQRLEIDIGLGGAFDVDSKDNKARAGMPDLDLLVEAGPKATWHFNPKKDPLQVDLSLEVRAVIATRFVAFDYEGFTVNPQLSVFDREFMGTHLRAYGSVGPIFGYDGVNEYFYQVDRAYATPDRPAYRAKNGYIGTKSTLGLAYPVTENLLLFTATQVGYYGGAANADSPLHRDNLNVNVGAGIRWSFWHSDARVPIVR
ncbi:MipA/OmpV family protein [Niveispirillum sp. BGYR6]|uniref:MipA/OmpV family protein n=1 Tax=Niveispirillum sp. BGYR6 TaxID=2971249 RepID=UPI0022B9A831|nr:MipA/OmpV family protein [Niveispirillum sp. BGYR6]MDG5496806.1 MipA/OmpV family protein [Niveispirillum sp. BGYR6]